MVGTWRIPPLPTYNAFLSHHLATGSQDSVTLLQSPVRVHSKMLFSCSNFHSLFLTVQHLQGSLTDTGGTLPTPPQPLPFQSWPPQLPPPSTSIPLPKCVVDDMMPQELTSPPLPTSSSPQPTTVRVGICLPCFLSLCVRKP